MYMDATTVEQETYFSYFKVILNYESEKMLVSGPNSFTF